MKIKEKFYDKKTVIKPWGHEHVAYRDKTNLAITVLNIKYKKKPHYIVTLLKKLALY